MDAGWFFIIMTVALAVIASALVAVGDKPMAAFAVSLSYVSLTLAFAADFDGLWRRQWARLGVTFEDE